MSFDSISPILLLKVFDRLPFKDRVRLRGVNLLFNEVSDRSINNMRSLEINGDLKAYSSVQSLSSLLESCSSNLQSINAIDSSSSDSMLSTLAEFEYPKLDRLKITVTNDDLTRKLISQSRNLRSVILYLNQEFEWPKDIIFEKLEKFEIGSSNESNDVAHVDLSPTLRPLIGMVPNLKQLVIDRDIKMVPFILSAQELSQLLVVAPCMEKLYLNLSPGLGPPSGPFNTISSPSGQFVNMCQEFVAAMPTWNLPNLTSLVIDLNYPFPSSILLHFSTTCPRLDYIDMSMVREIDDQIMEALSKLEKLRRLSLVGLELTEEKATKMINSLPSIFMLCVKKIDPEAFPALQQLQHLRVLYLLIVKMTKAQIIDFIANFPGLSKLGISAILDASTPEAFIDFVTSTADLFHQRVKIRVLCMRVDGTESELTKMNAVLEEMKKNGGPVVEMDGQKINMIRYNH